MDQSAAGIVGSHYHPRRRPADLLPFVREVASLAARTSRRNPSIRPAVEYAIAAGYVALRRAFAAPPSSQVWLYILLDAFLLAGSLFVLRSQHGLLLPMSLFPAWAELIKAEEAQRKQEKP